MALDVVFDGKDGGFGAIAALVGPGDVVFCDRKNHASLFDGCRLSRADVRVYPHADCRRLADLLEKSFRGDGSDFRGGGHAKRGRGEHGAVPFETSKIHKRRRLIVTDSLFSMDGDLAPLGELADLAERYEAMLFVDEAHATGVLGAGGRGAAELLGVEHRVHVRVGTLSKALGSVGGFVAGSRRLIEWLANRARTYVFSTAMPAASAAAALSAIDIVETEPQRREILLARAHGLREELRRRGWNTGASTCQIIPIIVGEPRRALELSARLGARGLFVPAMPDGEACLRISLTTGHSEEMIEKLLEALEP